MNAETHEAIAAALRLRDNPERMKAQEVADRLLSKKSIWGDGPGLVIHAPRRSGKTWELLKYAESKNPWGQYIVVCHNFEHQQQVIKTHWEIFNKIDQAARVAARLLGKPVTGQDVNSPLMVSPGMYHLLRGNSMPIYIDELAMISNEDLMPTVLATGRFVAAVTS